MCEIARFVRLTGTLVLESAQLFENPLNLRQLVVRRRVQKLAIAKQPIKFEARHIVMTGYLIDRTNKFSRWQFANQVESR